MLVPGTIDWIERWNWELITFSVELIVEKEAALLTVEFDGFSYVALLNGKPVA